MESIKNLPLRNEHFVGRESSLANIKKEFLKHNLVYLTGYGGIGKTQLAMEYCYLNTREYDLIWWFDLKNDLKIQYENLLTHLSNSGNFEKLLHLKVKDIPSEVIIDFTDSLLVKSNRRWLLVFDNAGEHKLNLSKSKNPKQHIIVTTREQQGFGNNTITVGPFTDQEAAHFLGKKHPTEKKEELIKLHKTLHNYPLALAQVSEAILMHQRGVQWYFDKQAKRDQVRQTTVGRVI